MNTYLRCLFTAGVMAVALASSANGQLLVVNVPPVPSNIQVPTGNVPYLKAHAVGTQNYICRATDTGFAWTLFGPQATLFIKIDWFPADIQQQVMTHFLSPNPDEAGLARPTWQSSLDTSAVWGKAVASSTDPNFVAAGAIPWLLVEIVGAERGPSGGSSLTQTTYIHRLSTSEGVAPASGCSQTSNVGAAVLVPYSTDYYFYKAAGR
jgi:hypothetical protein